jgi:hypothetical protein
VVIGTEFAWAHLPKTGGDATAQLFDLFPEVVVHADPVTHEKHARFAERADEVGDRRRVLNFRRLPSWMLSVAMFRASYGEHPGYEPTPMRSPQEMAESRRGDQNLLPFLDDAIHHWLRMETLAEDFLEFIASYTTVGDERRERALALGPVNALGYDHVLSHWFTEEQIEQMYASNPGWAQVERALYGELVTLEREPVPGPLTRASA